MKAIRIKHYKIPRYPAKLVALENPKLLEKNIPAAWKTREMAGAVAILLAANLSACNEKKSTGKETQAAIVAPVFNHGEDRAGLFGALGYIGPTTLLTEDEALKIIKEELGKNGIKLTRQNVKFEQVAIPSRSCKRKIIEKNGEKIVEEKVVTDKRKFQVFEADLVDPEKKVVVEFINEKNYFENGGMSRMGVDYDFIEAAQYLNNQIKQKGPKMYFGTFYDPGGARGSSGQLKLQIKDFVDWLKAQGVI